MRLSLAALVSLTWLVACGSSPPASSSTPPSKKPPPTPQAVDLLSAVNPIIGTGGDGFNIGSGYPGPALPYAMIHPGPDTRTATGSYADFFHCSGYFYDDTQIDGFSLTRMEGTGAIDYGNFGIMPLDGMSAANTTETGYAVGYSHDDEHAEPGYYSVTLASKIEVEITSTLRAALFRFTFPAGVDPVVLLDAHHTIGGNNNDGNSVQVDAASGALTAHTHDAGGMSSGFGGFDLYAKGVFDTPPSEVGTWDDSGLVTARASASGTAVGAYARFAKGTKSVLLRVAVSFVDAAGASKNLGAEIPKFDFDAVRTAAHKAWSDALGAVSLYDANDTEATEVATALYHLELMPTLMSDVDGRARAVGGAIVQNSEARYSDFSLWDTYRTLHPWLLLNENAHAGPFADSMLDMAKEGGALPRWALANGDTHTMIGSPGEIVVADTALAGQKLAMSGSAAYQLARVDAFGPSPGKVGGRDHIQDYMALGYVPSDDGSGSVSRTLEYASADAALATWAKRLGKTGDAQTLAARAEAAVKALYDPSVGYFRPKKKDGAWDTWSGPTAVADAYTEGDASQYLWMVPQDPAELATLLGGTAAAVKKLQTFFSDSEAETPILGHRSYYWPGNEPDIVAPWMFAAWGDPADTVEAVDWLFDSVYGTGPGGIPGNDDSGAMSAWLAFAATGLYPLPGTDRFVVAAPHFARIVLHRPSGDLTIEADPDPHTAPIPESVTLDGKALAGPYLSYEQLAGQHTLSFTMGTK
jgi:predicted alpha-1,2-mannosidase